MSPLPTERLTQRLAGRLAPLLPRWPLAAGRGPTVTAFVRDDEVFVYDGADGVPRRHGVGDEWIEAHAGMPMWLLLSGRVTHQLLVGDPALPLHDADALLAWARHQFVHYHGPQAERWVLAAWMAGAQRGASAAHGVDLDACARRCARAGVRLRAAHPWWAVALQAAGRHDPALADAAAAQLWVLEGVHATRLSVAAGRLVAIDQHWLEAPEVGALATLASERMPEDDVPAWVLGYGLRTCGALPAGWRVLGALDGDAPARQWLPGRA